MAHPKPDGYRAKHLVMRKDGVLIAVRLRTATQHAWAELVEQLDRDHGLQLKAGRADPQVTATLRRASETFAQLEAGELDWSGRGMMYLFSVVIDSSAQSATPCAR